MTDDNEEAPYFDRDYSAEFSVKLEWREWNKLWSLAAQGIDKKEADEWTDEELARDRELRSKLASKISQASPGNGMGDWPESMKHAYDEAVAEMFDEMYEDGQT